MGSERCWKRAGQNPDLLPLHIYWCSFPRYQHESNHINCELYSIQLYIRISRFSRNSDALFSNYKTHNTCILSVDFIWCGACLWCEKVVTKCLLVQPLNLSFFIPSIVSAGSFNKPFLSKKRRGKVIIAFNGMTTSKRHHQKERKKSNKDDDDDNNDNNTAKYMSFARSHVIYCYEFFFSFCKIFIYVFSIPASFKYYWI